MRDKKEILSERLHSCIDKMLEVVDVEYQTEQWFGVMKEHIEEYRESVIPAEPEHNRHYSESCERLSDGKYLNQ